MKKLEQSAALIQLLSFGWRIRSYDNNYTKVSLGYLQSCRATLLPLQFLDLLNTNIGITETTSWNK